jgi:2-(1,2-epoxy-1,2-dihydrophenyl)acetyl-CoA isomerase
MSYQTILFEVTDGVARLTLNRPERLNSFNTAMHAEVREALGSLRGGADGVPTARVLVLTGAGRGFCAGQDLGDRAVAPGGAAADLGESIEKNYKPLVMALRTLPIPVIGAVNGVAAGGSASWGWCPTPAARGRCRDWSEPLGRWGWRCSMKS